MNIFVNKSGFGLMEVMISIGIAALTISTMTTMMVYQTKSVNDLKTQLEIADFVRSASLTFSVTTVCTRNLQGQTLTGNTYNYPNNATIWQNADLVSPLVLATVGQPLSVGSPTILQAASVSYIPIGTPVAQPPVTTDVAGFYSGVYYGCNGVPGPCNVTVTTNQNNANIKFTFTRVAGSLSGATVGGSASVFRTFGVVVNTNNYSRNAVSTTVISSCL